MVEIIRRISKGTRFNQIYLQKEEGFGFEPGSEVVITPLKDLIHKEPKIFEYNTKICKIKKEIIRSIFQMISKYQYDNIIITGSFLNKGFEFEDIDIIIIDPKGIKEPGLKKELENNIGAKVHLILIDSKSFQKGVAQDPLFKLMVDRFASSKRILIKKKTRINYKLLDIYLIKNKNLLDGFDLFSVKQRKKLLREFISIKLFAENKKVSIINVHKETERLFGKNIIEKIFYYGDMESRKKFLSKLKKEHKKLEKRILENVSE